MWFNAIVAVFASLETAFNFLQPHISGNVYAYGMAILTVGNAILRVVTTQALKDK